VLSIEDYKSRFIQFRKSAEMPHWKLSYAESMLQRAGEFHAVGQIQASQALLLRLDIWMQKHSEKSKDRNSLEHKAKGLSPWNEAGLQNEIGRIQNNLDTKRHLIPRPEFLRFQDELLTAAKPSGGESLRSRLNQIRGRLISRLSKSFRARRVAPAFGKPFAKSEGHSNVGPYNNQRNYRETFRLIGERDPIWVEDAMELYNELLNFEQKLVPPNLVRPRRSGEF
jgi:hypothetical protein